MWQKSYLWTTRSMAPIWRDFAKMNMNMDFLLGGTSGPTRAKFPAINAWTNDQGILLSAEIAGIDPENIELTVVDQTLTISGSRDEQEIPENAEYKRRERIGGDFSRSFELPFKVDKDKVEASFQNGVLTVTLPRIPEEQPRKIEVKTG